MLLLLDFINPLLEQLFFTLQAQVSQVVTYHGFIVRSSLLLSLKLGFLKVLHELLFHLGPALLFFYAKLLLSLFLQQVHLHFVFLFNLLPHLIHSILLLN
jgi:hypothetical protein